MEAFNLLVQFVINDTSRVFKVDHIVENVTVSV